MSNIKALKSNPPLVEAMPAVQLVPKSSLPLAGLPLLLLFAVTLFVSAMLLFLVQPMIGRTLLPYLGGTPAVWNTCMVFFQALLLAGYAYAHASTTWLGVRRQAMLHLGVLLLPFLTLSLTVNPGLLDYGESSPIPRLLLVLFLSVGLPFFMVSASAPLLQKWFADTSHPAAKDPYFLYAASNLGSMLSLVGYPLVIEWVLEWGLPSQRILWRIGYGMLVLLTAGCAVCLWRSKPRESRIEDRESAGDGAATIGDPRSSTVGPLRQARWVALAFVPSSLMLGATTYMTTDIAAIPLLWVLPLALYLLSFILVFSRLPASVHKTCATLLPFLVLLLVFLMMSEWPLRIWMKILLHLVVLFVVAMVCHGELARDRPPTRYLTGFYLWMSFGGVLGGIFNAMVAPLIFNGIAEYPLVLVLACLLMPDLNEEKRTRIGPALNTGLMGFLFGAGAILLFAALGRTDFTLRGLTSSDGLWLAAATAAVLVVGFTAVRRDPDDGAARWLDLGLPVALGVLAAGLNLGLRITAVHAGYDRVLGWLYDAATSQPWSARFAFVVDPDSIAPLTLFIFVVPVVVCALFVNRPLRFGLAVGALLLANSFCDLLNGAIQLRQRSFFGALQVADDGTFLRLDHGTTLHGQQRLRWTRAEAAAGAAVPLTASDPLSNLVVLGVVQDTILHPGREPLTYFHRTGPVGQLFAAYHDHFAGKHIGVIGLGTGTIACYGQPNQKLTYFEIDPLIKRIAYDSNEYFTFVQNARDRGVDMNIVMGDARVKLEERAARLKSEDPAERPDKFKLLVIDAFSSDAIPMHLLTEQALKTYLHNLADDGLLIFHISNRYLDLEPVLGNLAKKMGLAGFVQTDWENGIPGKASSNWVVLAPRASTLDRLVHEDRWEEWREEHGWEDSQTAMWVLSGFPDAGGTVRCHGAICFSLFSRLNAPWRKLKVRPEVGIWTDDYSNIIAIFDWKN